ncbi:hypothetical protein MAN_05596, partial [Metarhizium hybridum]
MEADAANMGESIADVAEQFSLDSELAFEPDTKNTIVDLLKTLRNCIQECQKSDEKEVNHDGADITGSEDQQDLSPTDDADMTSPTASLFSSWSDDSDMSSSKSCDEDNSDLPSSESGDEDGSTSASDKDMSPLGSAKSEADELLRQLRELTVAMKKSKPNPRLQKADTTFQPTEHGELRDYLARIVLAQGFEKGQQRCDVGHKSLTPVQDRLIMANLRRRHRFLFAQRDAGNFESGPQNTGRKSTRPFPAANMRYPRPPRLGIGETKQIPCQLEPRSAAT